MSDDLLMILNQYGAGELTEERLEEMLRRLIAEQRLDAYEQGIDCRIHGKETTEENSSVPCSFEKCCGKFKGEKRLLKFIKNRLSENKR